MLIVLDADKNCYALEILLAHLLFTILNFIQNILYPGDIVSLSLFHYINFYLENMLYPGDIVSLYIIYCCNYF